jgi:hypothetical protein
MPVYNEERSTLHEMQEENLRLVKENNRLLHKLHRAQVFSFWSRIIFLLFVIGAPFFLYQYYLKEYIDGAFEAYGVLREDVTGLTETTSGLFDGGILGTLDEFFGEGGVVATTTEVE